MSTIIASLIQRYFAGALVTLMVALMSFSGGYDLGKKRERAQWEKARSAQAARSAQQQIAQAQESNRIVTQYVDRIQVIHEKSKPIIQKIPILSGVSCQWPAAFRMLHDAAADGSTPAGNSDAPAVSAETVAATVIDNYITCHEGAEQLKGLQEWIKTQK